MEMIHGMSVLEYWSTAVQQDQGRTQEAIIDVMLRTLRAKSGLEPMMIGCLIKYLSLMSLIMHM